MFWPVKYRNRHEPFVIKVYNYDEALPLLLNGEWFRPREPKWQHYVRAEVELDQSEFRTGIFHARWHSIQSRKCIGSGFIKFEKSEDPSDFVYVGESLRKNILDRLGLWVKHVNQKGKAANGNDMLSHIAAIPEEVVEADHMCEQMRDVIAHGFDAKIHSKRKRADKDAFEALKRKALIQLKENYGMELTREEYELIHPRKKSFDGIEFAKEEENIFELGMEDFSLATEDAPKKAESEPEEFGKQKNKDRIVAD